MDDFEKAILEADTLEITENEIIFAGGDRANNHLNLDRLANNPELLDEVTKEMAYLILAHNCNIEFLAPIPSGGDVLADSISGHLRREGVDDIPVIKFEKSDNGMFAIKDDYIDLLANLEEGVAIDDASTRLSSLRRFIQTPELKDKELSFCAIWRRGSPDIEIYIPIKKFWVVEREIPFILDKNSDLYEYVKDEN